MKYKTYLTIIIVILLVGGIGGFIGFKYYQDYKYKQSNEYHLLQLNYKSDDVKVIIDRLNDEEEKGIIDRGYDEFIPFFVKCDYFVYDKLDEYLKLVIRKEDDFFKYHGTDGYDYNKLVSIVNSHANETPYISDRLSDTSKGNGMIANKHYRLGEYTPDNLVKIEWKYRFGMANDVIEVTSETYDAYLEMWNAANAEGIYLLALSGYRSYSEQEKEYNYYKNIYGEAGADKIAARPGWSEHQTGLAIDIYSKESSSQRTFHESNSYRWLKDNSYKYGFIIRYPENMEEITGYEYESWHYRYLGKELAMKVHESGLTYDEYYAFYLDRKGE